MKILAECHLYPIRAESNDGDRFDEGRAPDSEVELARFVCSPVGKGTAKQSEGNDEFFVRAHVEETPSPRINLPGEYP